MIRALAIGGKELILCSARTHYNNTQHDDDDEMLSICVKVMMRSCLNFLSLRVLELKICNEKIRKAGEWHIYDPLAPEELMHFFDSCISPGQLLFAKCILSDLKYHQHPILWKFKLVLGKLIEVYNRGRILHDSCPPTSRWQILMIKIFAWFESSLPFLLVNQVYL